MFDLNLISTLIFIGLFFILITSLRHNYLIDLYRDRLFELRFNLFEYGNEKQIFDSNEYREMEKRINNIIGQLHRINPVFIIPLFLVEYCSDKKGKTDFFKKRKDTIVKDEKLKSLDNQLGNIVVDFFFTYSLIFNMVITLINYYVLISPDGNKKEKINNDRIQKVILRSNGLEPSCS